MRKLLIAVSELQTIRMDTINCIYNTFTSARFFINLNFKVLQYEKEMYVFSVERIVN